MADDEKKPDLPPPSLSRPPKAPPVEPIPKVTTQSTAPSMSPPPMTPPPPKVVKGAEPEVEILEDGAVAPVNTRIIAAVIDMLVAVGLQVAAMLILPGFADKISYLLGAAYIVTRDSLPFLKQGSIGKMAMKLRVERKSGGSIEGDWTAALIRNGALLIPLFGLVEAIVLFNREQTAQRGLRLGDEWAKTKVVVSVPPATED